jgi:hypothetical protein
MSSQADFNFADALTSHRECHVSGISDWAELMIDRGISICSLIPSRFREDISHA